MTGHGVVSETQQHDLDVERKKRRDELANLFDECDLDGSGSIVLEELRIVLKGKGYTDHFVEVCTVGLHSLRRTSHSRPPARSSAVHHHKCYSYTYCTHFSCVFRTVLRSSTP